MHHNKTIKNVRVFDQPSAVRELAAEGITPPATNLFTFEVSTTQDAFLVLDNYGDEILPFDFARNLLQVGPDQVYNLAVSTLNGKVYLATFHEEAGDFLSLSLVALNGTQVPGKFLRRLDELKSKKRPYFLTVLETYVWDFLAKEIGLKDLRENIVVHLDFDTKAIEVHRKDYREVSPWR